MKIRIIGNTGSGKTFLARSLSQKYSIQSFDLDDIFWRNTDAFSGEKRPPEERDALLNDIFQNEDWIIEGVYYSWCQNIFKDADVIYVLKTPLWLCRLRIIKRFIFRKLGIEKGRKESFSSFFRLIKWSKKFKNKNLPEIQEILEKHKNKTIYL